MRALEELTGAREAVNREWRQRRAVFAPPPSLTVSEWADQRRILSEGTTPEPGRWRTSRVPYLREIMDALGDPDVEHIVFLKSSRSGGTEAINNFLGYIADVAPAPTMVILPTVEEAKGWSKEQLAPMLRDTPCLRGKVRDSESGRRESRDTIQYKEFAGGSFVVMGSNSAAGLRRRNIQNVIGDERDAHAVSAKGATMEGDPFELAIKRTENFPNRTIFETSTPTVKGASRIERAFEQSDQRRYFVPCPFCGYKQLLRWRNLRWENNDPETVVYHCGDISKDGELEAGCGRAIPEDRKPWMMERGEWIPTYPERRIRGYRIWAAYSLLTSWGRLVAQWLKAQGNNELLQVFVNTVLAESWEEQGEQIEVDSLKARRAEYETEVPKGVGILTAGVDVQGDRLEVSVWGYGVGFESWLIKHEVLWGDPAKADVWEALDLVRSRAYMGPGGARYKIHCVCVDSGGHHTDEVYRYTRARQRQRVFSIKGSSAPGSAAIGRPTKGNRYKATLFVLGTEALKDTLFSRMKTDVVGPGYLHFPHLDDEYFRQLTSEKVVTRWNNGRPVRRYIKKTDRARGEALDCAAYSLAALMILGPTVYERLEYWVEKMQVAGDNREPATEAAGAAAQPRRHVQRKNWVTNW